MRLSTLISWILLLAVLAGVGYWGFTYYTDRRAVETEIDEMESLAPDKPIKRSRQAPGYKLDEAIAAEKKGKWDEAEKWYRDLAKIDESDMVKSKLTALANIRLARQAEKKGENQEALFFYRKARPALIDPSILNKPIERLEAALEYYALYEKGVAAEKTGQWEETAKLLQKAREIAPRAGISTAEILRKIRTNRARADKLRKERNGYYWLFTAFAALDDPYATIAVCDYYSSNDLFLSLRADIEARRADAVKSIGERRAEFPRLSVADDETLVRVHLKDGKAIEGALVSEDKMGLVVRDAIGDRHRNRLIARAALERLEKLDRAAAQEINNKAAEQLLKSIAKKCEERPTEVLGLLGRLFHEFPTAPILKDPRKQRTLILTTSLKAAHEFGDSIPKLLASSTKFFQKVCPVCGGTGHALCPACKGTGKVYEKCGHCKGTGVSYCGTCGGSGLMPTEFAQSDEHDPASGKRCPTCRGTGTRACARCNGKGGYWTVCTQCRQGRRATCPACRGTGQRPRGKFGPEDIKRLKKALRPE
ncbi:MAG: hypothetical protein GXP25_02620 [Planctomycetes bacterium]|nr:hypothetical protein [Planctomycetota bacterium]